MDSALRNIHAQLGITAEHLESCKLEFHPQSHLNQLIVVDMDFEGKPFVLRADAAQAWSQMRTRAFHDNVYLQPFSGFRSYLHQRRLIERQLKGGRSIEAILTHIAIPGFSEHHTGRAIDIHSNDNPILEEAFEKSDEFNWLNRNANTYGFRLSYPRSNDLGIIYEPWHWYFAGLSNFS